MLSLVTPESEAAMWAEEVPAGSPYKPGPVACSNCEPFFEQEQRQMARVMAIIQLKRFGVRSTRQFIREILTCPLPLEHKNRLTMAKEELFRRVRI